MAILFEYPVPFSNGRGAKPCFRVLGVNIDQECAFHVFPFRLDAEGEEVTRQKNTSGSARSTAAPLFCLIWA
jgi:hypothetical protein